MTAVSTSPAASTYSIDTSGLAPALCRNCEAALTGDFCARCGQYAKVERITLRAFAHEIAGQLLELDRGLLHTFVELLRRPGPTIKGYIEGKRRSLTSPITFVLIAGALSLLRSSLTPNTQAALNEIRSQATQTFTFFTPARMAFFQHEMDLITTNKFAMDAFLLVPTVLMMRWLFRRAGFNLAELAVFGCYAIGEATLISVAIGAPLMFVLTPKQESLLFTSVTMAYLIYAGLGFFPKRVSTAIKLVLSVALGVVFMDAALFLAPVVFIRH